ncbi:MAG TPA: hypothetical protein VG604_02235 [Candidatus Saccharimonadales bacterium]|nr:hypothetical protein [Candidatus Saccharimonadales bacterium]
MEPSVDPHASTPKPAAAVVSSRPKQSAKLPLIPIAGCLLLVGLFVVYILNSNQVGSLRQQLTNVQGQLSQVNNQASDVNDTIDGKKYQAVFLTSGQVYFGKLSILNSQYVKLTDIYYLQNGGKSSADIQQSSDSNDSVSLVKLGCELHAPEDDMTISRSQVNFWENLEPSGQVVKAIRNFTEQNPDGQTCS